LGDVYNLITLHKESLVSFSELQVANIENEFWVELFIYTMSQYSNCKHFY
jgi:hypothetical protein